VTPIGAAGFETAHDLVAGAVRCLLVCSSQFVPHCSSSLLKISSLTRRDPIVVCSSQFVPHCSSSLLKISSLTRRDPIVV